MGKRWTAERKGEHYYKEAKKSGYRSRAVYKLKQMNRRFSIVGRGGTVVDLGCSPGGWCEVLLEIVGKNGKVIGLDIARMRPVEGVTFIRGDIRDEDVRGQVAAAIGERPVDAVVSDMSPNLTGQYSTDHARSIELAEMALEFARARLRPGGNLLVKVFQGDLFRAFLDTVKRDFANCRAHSPKASRARSSEIYVIGKGFRKD